MKLFLPFRYTPPATRRVARVGLVLYLALLGVLVVAVYYGLKALQAG
jgi:hypothetical protein